MPFWWRRRRKPWFGRWTRFRKRRNYKPRRKRRRVYRRRRTYRAYKGRRRRRYKVRRKQKKIIVRQWQPESIKKCKVKGVGTLVLGAEGTQYRCYTDYINEWTNPKVPAGGGFGCELFTLQYLYKMYVAKKNIWTSSNKYRDLTRYTGCKFTMYRHPETDFIVAYDIQPPFYITKHTYMSLHPQMLLLRKNKRIVLSTATKPNGRLTKKLKIKPPKQLSTKWFFQKDFAKYGLVAIAASACNFRYPWLACCNENLIITLYYLQADFYHNSAWAQTTSKYNPVNSPQPMKETLKFKYYLDGKSGEYTMNAKDVETYDKSVSLDTGWFNKKILNAYEVDDNTTKQALTPTGTIRYNPADDDGVGNKLWVVNTLTYNWKIPTDDDLILENYPLWLMFYGYTSFLYQVKADKNPFSSSLIIVKSKAIQRVFGTDTRGWYPLIDKSFMNGKGPGNTPPILLHRKYWYPSIYGQRDSISQIVNCGPYVPKYNETKNSTWQLNYTYNFYFKWGGTYPPIPEAENPENKTTYPVPDKQQETISIADPISEKYETVFKSWDYRRGSLTKTALKRMQENIQTDDSLSTDSTGCSSPKKKKFLPTLQNPKKENKKIQSCLLSLCEENTWQEPTPDTNIYQLLQQQHQQQQSLKLNLLTLIADLKSNQRNLLHQAGYLA
uniref:Capsid protein n=1 Tax=Gammatorquevirus homidi6 TaxID=3048391 RepID=A0AAU7ST68_9VIRU